MSADVPRPPRKGQDPPAARHLRLVTDAPPKPRAKHRRPAPPFTAEEEARIRAALTTSRRTFGTWVELAQAMGLDVAYVHHVKASRRLTGDFAIRLARSRQAVGVAVPRAHRGGRLPYVRGEASTMKPAQARLWAIVASERPMVIARVKQRVLPHAVEDAVQTVLERAARLILRDRLVIAEGIDARPIVRAWLTAIIRRACTEVRRTEVAAKRTHDAMAEEVRAAPDPMIRLIAREELAQVPRGLRALDLVTLDAFMRHGGHYANTAAELRIPIGSLSTRIHEIRAYLRRRRALDK